MYPPSLDRRVPSEQNCILGYRLFVWPSCPSVNVDLTLQSRPELLTQSSVRTFMANIIRFVAILGKCLSTALFLKVKCQV